MAHVTARKRKRAPRRVLAWPDLEQAKSAVLSSLTSASGQRTYDHAICEFVGCYLGCKQKLRCAVNDRLGIEPDAAA